MSFDKAKWERFLDQLGRIDKDAHAKKAVIRDSAHPSPRNRELALEALRDYERRTEPPQKGWFDRLEEVHRSQEQED
jgi:hypothetical protein